MRRKARKGGGRQVELTVASLAGQGDGLVELDGRPLFLPLTVPGDRVLARVTGSKGGAFQGEVVELLDPGLGRIDPPCPHFGPCGGCALQHLDDAHYRDWKAGLVSEALSKRGFTDVEIWPMVTIPPGTRRRATLATRRQGKRILLGFHERRSHRIVDLTACLLLHPDLFALLAPLRALLVELMADGEEADIVLTLSETGVDLLIAGPPMVGLQGQEALTAFAEAQDLARLTWSDGETDPLPLLERRAPRLTFGKIAVTPPPGGFLQPSEEGQSALTSLVLEAAPETMERAVDLFCGCGTFTFPLAERSKVIAVEGDAVSLAALWQAARTQGLAGPVQVLERDLARQPFGAEELVGTDFLVFDPPRAGAKAQAEHLAESDVPVICAVSCNPTTFARDARILVEGGYRLDWVAPVDQFAWSAHLELVARFTR